MDGLSEGGREGKRDICLFVPLSCNFVGLLLLLVAFDSAILFNAFVTIIGALDGGLVEPIKKWRALIF